MKLPPDVTILGTVTESPLPINSFRVAIIADRDTNSAVGDGGVWMSNLRVGLLKRNNGSGKYKISWEKEIILHSSMNENGRGMELSELLFWNEMLLTFDDRTGIVFEIIGKNIYPRYILNDGDGDQSKGFKSEWATVKDNKIVVGSMGKEWTTGDGIVLSHNPQYVKIIDDHGQITDMSWETRYNALREKAGCPSPGYLIHEAVVWNSVLHQWFFLPRRVSIEKYDEKLDEERGSNLMLIANEDFSLITEKRVGPLIASHGFSSVKFIPGSTTDLVALKTEELNGSVSTYMMVFNLLGEVLMNEVKIGDVKFEGVEFVPDAFFDNVKPN